MELSRSGLGFRGTRTTATPADVTRQRRSREQSAKRSPSEQPCRPSSRTVSTSWPNSRKTPSVRRPKFSSSLNLMPRSESGCRRIAHGTFRRRRRWRRARLPWLDEDSRRESLRRIPRPRGSPATARPRCESRGCRACRSRRSDQPRFVPAAGSLRGHAPFSESQAFWAVRRTFGSLDLSLGKIRAAASAVPILAMPTMAAHCKCSSGRASANW